MKNTYRISVYNRTTGKRELMWDRFTSKKKAQEMANAMNVCDPDKIVQARVFVEDPKYRRANA